MAVNFRKDTVQFARDPLKLSVSNRHRLDGQGTVSSGVVLTNETIRLEPPSQRRLGNFLAANLGLPRRDTPTPLQLVTRDELSCGNELASAHTTGPPDKMVCSDVEYVAGLRVQAQHFFHAVGLGSDDLGEPVGVVHLGADGVISHQFADGNEPSRGGHQGVVGLARRYLLRRAGPDVEPDRRVEGEDLVDERVGELVLEDLGVLGAGEVPVLPAGRDVLSDHAVDQLLEAPLPLRGADRAAEVLGGGAVGGVDGPEVGELDPTLLEVDRAVPPVGHDDIAALPSDLVVRVHALPGVNAPDRESLARALAPTRRRPAHRLRHVHPPSGIPADPTRARPGPSVDVIVRTRTPYSEPNLLLRKGASARPYPAAPCAARKSRPRNQ